MRNPVAPLDVGRLEIIRPNGDRLQIDPFHDDGYVVLGVETYDPGDLRTGAGDISLSLRELGRIGAWIETHRAVTGPDEASAPTDSKGRKTCASTT